MIFNKFLITVVLVLTTILLSVEGKGRIYNGESAENSDYKYFVQIKASDGADGSAQGFCGGSLIAPDWVMTAAHCFDKGKFATVYMGFQGKYSAKTMRSDKVFIHREYFHNYSLIINDIALVKIDEIDFNQYPSIDTIWLPDEQDDVHGGEFVAVSGLGRTELYSSSSTLKTAYLEVLSAEECVQYFGDKYNSNQICTNSPTQNACPGDSGGPVVRGLGKNAIQVGLVSYGYTDDCVADAPVAHTRVFAFIQWITDTMKNN